ncbi:MAG TPA: malate synthase G [Galbitalea sp.]|nr:malate synthase G [Galbitalea sp.]
MEYAKVQQVTDRISAAGLSVDAGLFDFVEREVLPVAGLDAAAFWTGFAGIVGEFSPRIRGALARRDNLQLRLDEWHTANPGPIADAGAYRSYLREIGYLENEPADYLISTSRVDTEIAQQAGPQLVVPLLNARFAANAANARWGSLYDALYGTDAIPTDGALAPGDEYNVARGAVVVARGRAFLDAHFPLTTGSHADASKYLVNSGVLTIERIDGSTSTLTASEQFVGFAGDAESPTAVVLVNHGLHVEIAIDRNHPIGSTDPAGVRDLVLEAAVTTIMDLEDSVSAVDAEDKVLGYRNWLALMQGTLSAPVTKAGKTFVRTMNADRRYSAPDGSAMVLHGRSMMFIRHVGHFMFTDAILDAEGNEVPEGVLDAVVTSLAAAANLRGEAALANSRTGSLYIVKPKMHGPAEVAITVDLFAAVERLAGFEPRTLKIGIMDEERRTTLNLKAAIFEARDRVVFINTGFLDRTGDEIHTSRLAGPFVRKADLKIQSYIGAYEEQNVDVGLRVGFSGVAQIGKGMWAMPEKMAAMLEQKSAQLKAGATTAWVPSPTAATLHALQYHDIDVFAVQNVLRSRAPRGIDPILEVPVVANPAWTNDERRDELDGNVQSILGYVVRWVEQGIGCSTVPDLGDVGLMEDRATLRISSQLLGNWLAHGILSAAEVEDSLVRVSSIVDRQNAGDSLYTALRLNGKDSLALRAARDLILLASQQPNGYTEPILHRYRRQQKAATR